MSGPNLAFSVADASQQQEQISISMNGRPAGEVTIQYRRGFAAVDARLNLHDAAVTADNLSQLHGEFSTELLAFVANRGAMAQDTEGQVTYHLGLNSVSLELPSNPEAGLGYPNSW